MMDCVLPSRNARNGCLFTSQGPCSSSRRAIRTIPGRSIRRAGAIRARIFPARISGTCSGGETLSAALATLHNLQALP